MENENGQDGQVPIIPADLGLRISLPDFGIFPKGATIPKPARDFRAWEFTERTDYR